MVTLIDVVHDVTDYDVLQRSCVGARPCQQTQIPQRYQRGAATPGRLQGCGKGDTTNFTEHLYSLMRL